MLIDGFSKIVLLRAIVGACVCVFQRPQHCATLRVALSTPRAPLWLRVKLPQASPTCAPTGVAVRLKLCALLVTLSW